IAWTTGEEIALDKGWVAVSENSKYGNARKEHGFWCEVLEYIERKTKQYVCRTYVMESGSSNEDYINRALIHYQVETVNTFKYRHCWEVLKDSLKSNTQELPKFATESEGGSKRHKSSGSSSFDTESVDASINLNINVSDNDEDDALARGCGSGVSSTPRRQKVLSPYDHLIGDQQMPIDEAMAVIKAKYNLRY
nr:hypothetical protein [Tanacetum cinerariifolium]